MKIKDLIKLLKTYPDEMRIVVPGYEGGYDFLHDIKKDTVALGYNKNAYMGDHELASEVNKAIEQFKRAIPIQHHAETKASFIKRVEHHSSLQREDVLIIS